MTKTILTSAIVAVIVLVVGLSFLGGGGKVTERIVDLGGSSGTDHSFRESFNGGFTVGGAIVSTTTTATTYTTIAKDFGDTATVMSWLPNVSTTVSLSSTSTLGLIPKVGDSTTINFRNASSTDAATITFAAVDANLDIQMNEGTGGDLVLNGEDWMRITFIHTSQYLVTAILVEMIEGD